MPDLIRPPFRFDCNGIDLVHPIDRMPEGYFPYLFNARVVKEGRLDGRPGYGKVISMADQPNSIARLNDPSKLVKPGGYTYVGGGGANLYAGIEAAYAPIDNGYSGDPLSLIQFKPDQSPDSWMYVYDRNKQSKVRSDGLLRAVGVVPPNTSPIIDYGHPAEVDIEQGQTVGGWVASGVSSTPVKFDRTNASNPVINFIQYNTEVTGGPYAGWACINPSITTKPFWQGERMKISLGGAWPTPIPTENVAVHDILNAITSTTLVAIIYDSGNTGLCSMKLFGDPTGLERNSLISLNAGQPNAEIVRVLSVIPSPDGIGYSVRCNTELTHTVSSPLETVDGLISWYVYTTLTHVAGEAISSNAISVTHASSGVGALQDSAAPPASQAGGRPVSQANDFLHISLFLQNPQNVTNIQLLMSLDVAPNFSFTNPGNSLIWTITPAMIQAGGSSGGSSGDAWTEIVVPISAATRSGADFTRSLSTVSGIAIQMTSTGACSYGFDWWYLFGTYGSVIQPNSPVGVTYQTRFRDSVTGARSVPGPLARYQLFPLREAVFVTPQTSTQLGVDTIDIYRIGGAVTTPLYVGSVANNPALPATFSDALPDSQVLQVNQPPDLTVLQPWPILQPPWNGTCHTVGTTVVADSGHPFNTALLNNTVILLNGVAFLTFGQPRSQSVLEVTQDAGNMANVTFQIGSPTLAGQTLPYAFGPLEGPFAPIVFALGDPLNGDVLYFSNFSDADSASDANTMDLDAPSHNLVSGNVWNGLVFVGSRQDVFCLRYSYLTTIGASGNTSFQKSKVNTPSGIWSRWACCVCPIGLAYLGRDGIYICTDTTGVNITDATLYPLFPHEGQAATTVLSGSNVILPVDMTKLSFLRLTYCDERLKFCYVDTGGNFNTLEYEIYRKRWTLHNYADKIGLHYLVEASAEAPNDMQILQLAMDTHSIMKAGGDTDNGSVINTVILTPSMDSGDERTQKLYVDSMTQVDGNGTIQLAAAYDNAQSFSPVINLPATGSIQQVLQSIASLTDLSTHRNIGAKFAFTGGPDGPKLLAWEISGYPQPYLSTHLVTQFFGLSFPAWKHHRRAFPALLSTAPVTFTIKCQNGRTFAYTIPSTNGQFLIQPVTLDQTIKDLAFAYQLDSPTPFAMFPSEFTIETKSWNEETFVNLAVWKA